ncbi:hypothetical protein E2320_014474, partial [Naja naja]
MNALSVLGVVPPSKVLQNPLGIKFHLYPVTAENTTTDLNMECNIPGRNTKCTLCQRKICCLIHVFINRKNLNCKSKLQSLGHGKGSSLKILSTLHADWKPNSGVESDGKRSLVKVETLQDGEKKPGETHGALPLLNLWNVAPTVERLEGRSESQTQNECTQRAGSCTTLESTTKPTWDKIPPLSCYSRKYHYRFEHGMQHSGEEYKMYPLSEENLLPNSCFYKPGKILTANRSYKASGHGKGSSLKILSTLHADWKPNSGVESGKN